jgi:ABC-2 type transport system permease protein
MLHSVLGMTLHGLRRTALAYTLGIVATVAAMAALWPSIRGMEGIEELLGAYPEGLQELFRIDTVTTGPGYLNAELFSIVLPALFIVLAISHGARLVAGEEEDGTLETLLLTPPSRGRVLLEKAAGLAAVLVGLGAVLAVTVVAASAVVDLGIGVGDAVVGAAAMVLLGLVHGGTALAVGAATGRRGVGAGAASALALVGDVWYVATAFVEALQPYRWLSPFTQALEAGPLGGGLQPSFGWLLAVAVMVVATAWPVFERRDLVLP